jgi:Polyketide cyclase / dehydrase and lipid transport
LRTAEARIAVRLDPDDAFALWADPARWPAFVEGFGRLASVDREWPGPGAKAVWDSIPGGRGRVTEQVTERDGARLSMQVFEDAMAGTQTFAAVPGPDGGSVVQLRLDYELARGGPLNGVADWLFIRRALRDALRRTLQRFAVEAEEDAGLR